MALAIAIVLSSLILGTVTLFVATKDRWNWRVIFKRVATVSVFASLLGAFVLGAAWHLARRPSPETSLCNVSLGMSNTDVRFVKGVPSDTSITGLAWTYNEHRLNMSSGVCRIGLNAGRVTHIIYDGFSPYYTVLGYTTQDYFDDVEDRLGSPTHTEQSSDGLTRLYFYDRYNAFFLVGQDWRITSIGLFDPAHGYLVFRSQP